MRAANIRAEDSGVNCVAKLANIISQAPGHRRDLICIGHQIERGGLRVWLPTE